MDSSDADNGYDMPYHDLFDLEHITQEKRFLLIVLSRALLDYDLFKEKVAKGVRYSSHIGNYKLEFKKLKRWFINGDIGPTIEGNVKFTFHYILQNLCNDPVAAKKKILQVLDDEDRKPFTYYIQPQARKKEK